MYIDFRDAQNLREFGVGSIFELEFYHFYIVEEFLSTNKGHKIIIFDNFEYGFQEFSHESVLIDFCRQIYDERKDLTILIVVYDPHTKSKILACSNIFIH
jgi:dTDP-4-dehydrorhamnose 3,5-epimerase-like enzyme